MWHVEEARSVECEVQRVVAAVRGHIHTVKIDCSMSHRKENNEQSAGICFIKGIKIAELISSIFYNISSTAPRRSSRPNRPPPLVLLSLISIWQSHNHPVAEEFAQDSTQNNVPVVVHDQQHDNVR
jgi:hypothetical protein